METVEMDLMQAQIGSLATDVSRLEAKVAKGGGGGFEVTFTNPDISEWQSLGKITATPVQPYDEILGHLQAGDRVYSIIDLSPLHGNGIFQILYTYQSGNIIYGGAKCAYDPTANATAAIYGTDPYYAEIQVYD